jgi:hypothetical protein
LSQTLLRLQDVKVGIKDETLRRLPLRQLSANDIRALKGTQKQ